MESNVDLDSVAAVTPGEGAVEVLHYHIGGVHYWEAVLSVDIKEAIVGAYCVYTGKYARLVIRIV